MRDKQENPANRQWPWPARLAVPHAVVLLPLLLVVALGFWLRILGLHDQSYWGDEVISMVVSRTSPASIVDWVKSTAEPHPPLYYVMLHYWTRLVGENEMVTRYLSSFFGTLSLPLIFVLGRILLGQRAGLAGVLLLATNSLNVLQSRDARMYAVFVFLTLLSTVVMLSALRRQSDRRRTMLAYVVTALVGLFIHYYFVLVLAAHGLFLVIFLRHRLPLLRPWLAAWLAIIVAYSPWLLFAGSVLFTYQGFTWSPTHLGFDTFGQAIWTTMIEFSGAKALGDEWWSSVATAIVSGLLIVAVIVWARRGPAQMLLLVLAFLLPILTIYAASLRRPIFQPKYLIAATPFFLLLLAGVAFLISTRRRWVSFLPSLLLVPVLATNALSLANSYLDPNLANPDYRSAARLVSRDLRDNDGFVFGHWGVKLQFTYYYGSEPLHYLPPGRVAGHEAEIEAALSEVIRVFPRVWFVPYWKSDIDLFIEDWLDRHAFKSQNDFAGKVKVILYSSPKREETRDLLAKPLRFANGLFLDAATVGSSAVQPGESFNLNFSWRLAEKTGDNLKAALRLTDESGHVFGMVDRRLLEQATADWWPGQSANEKRGLLVGPGTPPGDYRLELVVYRETDGRAIEPTDQSGSVHGGAVLLGVVKVAPAAAPPRVEAIPLPKRLNADLNEEIRLLGAGSERPSARPGDPVAVTVFWQARRDAPANYSVVVSAVNARGAAGQSISPVVEGRYPMARWTAGEIVRDHYQMIVSPKAEPGTYTLKIGLTKAGRESQAATDGEVAFGTLVVKAKERNFAVPTPSRTTSTDFGGAIRLLGYDLTTSEEPREAKLILYWRALQETETSYTVFVHILDAGQQVSGQSDSIPVAGTSPTTGWVKDEVIADPYRVSLRPEALPGTYVVEVGIYDAITGRRLTRDSGEDRIILEEISWR